VEGELRRSMGHPLVPLRRSIAVTSAPPVISSAQNLPNDPHLIPKFASSILGPFMESIHRANGSYFRSHRCRWCIV